MHGVRRKSITLMVAGLMVVCLLPRLLAAAEDARHPASCQPTPADALGPFYQPDAPFRSRVGTGYVLRGVVRSASQCQPIAGALIEFWLVGPDGRYGDAYRARLRTDQTGHYQFESNKPEGYGGRPAHIHIRVTAAGYKVLVTQHYPTAGQPGSGTFDLVLRPLQ